MLEDLYALDDAQIIMATVLMPQVSAAPSVATRIWIRPRWLLPRIEIVQAERAAENAENACGKAAFLRVACGRLHALEGTAE